MNQAELLEKANTLPLSPGVYIMRDKSDKVIYVGKSRKLKNRVSQYFQNSEKNVKTARMVSNVRNFDYYLCDNEMEALSLENNLIKQYTPKYNIRLKDAKSYPFLKITNEEYPRLLFTRKREADKAKYFGPYSGSGTAYSLLELLRKTLKLPSCHRSFPKDIGKERPCIYYQIGRCQGPCTGKVSAEDFRASMEDAASILNGQSESVRKKLEEAMYRYAAEERFEAAARCRDTVRAIDAIRQKQKVVASPDVEQDVVALYNDDFCSCISVFQIRSGILQDSADFVFGADSIPDAEEVISFLSEHYRSRSYIPPKILLAFEAEEEDCKILSDFLTDQADRKVTVHIPERGQWKTLCALAEKNAAEKARQYRNSTEQEEKTLGRLAQLLQLEVLPQRIESYDISNFGKENLTAGMIVCKDGKFSKSDYRSFKIKSVEGTDDYASMREALSRRFAHLSDAEGSFSELPDLILLDGGKGHVSVIRELVSELGISVPVFGMVKDDYHKTRALCTDTEEISIALERDVFRFVYGIQEEVHRYSIGQMQKAKGKSVSSSSLTKIEGIGEVKAKKLLLAFDNLAQLKAASIERLESIQGISHRDAQTVYHYYHPNYHPNQEEESK